MLRWACSALARIDLSSAIRRILARATVIFPRLWAHGPACLPEGKMYSI